MLFGLWEVFWTLGNYTWQLTLYAFIFISQLNLLEATAWVSTILCIQNHNNYFIHPELHPFIHSYLNFNRDGKLCNKKNVIELKIWEYNVVEQLLSMDTALAFNHSLKEKRSKNNGKTGSFLYKFYWTIKTQTHCQSWKCVCWDLYWDLPEHV